MEIDLPIMPILTNPPLTHVGRMNDFGVADECHQGRAPGRWKETYRVEAPTPKETHLLKQLFFGFKNFIIETKLCRIGKRFPWRFQRLLLKG
ncbi:hypothetical protein F0U62_15095 [Cystobacter fuscus]|uniref:hypothetical protein n=1 Tax=Cystobacter fuscus TaxID=43 RepID=UPI002B2B4AE4|nr:hypothetical protein F0U62_15095 [Cystobacter fuscus]